MSAKWQPIETAPRDRPILGLCVHKADPYFNQSVQRLTIYGAFCEGGSHVIDGPHIIEWGGAWDDRSYEEPNAGSLPDWWFRYGSDFEETANPIAWMPIPEYENLLRQKQEGEG